jgi:hypothetical protein
MKDIKMEDKFYKSLESGTAVGGFFLLEIDAERLS